MNIQSLSIVVPTRGCINKCKFCVSRMHDNPYENNFDAISYRKRIKYAVMNNVNTLILTGTGEVLQNKIFLANLQEILEKEGHPFPNVEIQTTGVMLMDYMETIDAQTGELVYIYSNIERLKRMGVNTISLSVSDIFDSETNWDIIGAPERLRYNLDDLCGFIKEQGFNLRLSLNMTAKYNNYDEDFSEEILKRCKALGADQITFRQLYHSNDKSYQSEWVRLNSCDPYIIKQITEYIRGRDGEEHGFIGAHGKALYRLPFGAMVYSIMGMSVAVDDNCMAKNETESLKYIILRENGKLYCQWDDEGSLIF